ncbi:MAG TPA: hypothetical protein VG456_07380 [Candidatus Sulfopaludibacter sp.]|jgi:hypothetical protein|nr:hypothetical protein [Candidatus Sulfopaludibacter sp.]
MGQEIDCRMRHGARALNGRAFLETDHVLFRGAERVKILFKDLTGVHAAGGILKLDFAGGPAELELGPAAEKWAHKILHPPSRLDKLGVKEGLSVRLAGQFEEKFLAELRERKVPADAAKGKQDLIFFAGQETGDLAQIRKLAGGLKAAGALWVIYPKGVAAIREIEVIEAGRAAGLKDVKVAGFSATHTGLKFVIPLAARPLLRA